MLLFAIIGTGTDSNGCLTISNFGHCEFVLNNFDVDIRGRLLG